MPFAEVDPPKRPRAAGEAGGIGATTGSSRCRSRPFRQPRLAADELGVPVAVAGHSKGAELALAAAAHDPGPVQGVLAWAPSAVAWVRIPAQRQRRQRLPQVKLVVGWRAPPMCVHPGRAPAVGPRRRDAALLRVPAGRRRRRDGDPARAVLRAGASRQRNGRPVLALRGDGAEDRAPYGQAGTRRRCGPRLEHRCRPSHHAGHRGDCSSPASTWAAHPRLTESSRRGHGRRRSGSFAILPPDDARARAWLATAQPPWTGREPIAVRKRASQSRAVSTSAGVMA